MHDLTSIIGLVVICIGGLAAVTGNVALMTSLSHERQIASTDFWRRAGVMLAGLVVTTGGFFLQSA